MPHRQIAQGLLTIGCTLDGIQNEYTAGFLRNNGALPLTGVSEKAFEEAVIKTAKMGVMGSVTFFFTRTDKASNFIKAYDETAELIRLHREWEQLDDEGRKDKQEPPPLPQHSDEVIAQVLCIHAANARQIPKIVLSAPPVCNTLKGTTQKSGETSTGVTAGTTTGSGKVWGVMMSNEDRTGHMKLHHRIIKEWVNPIR